MITKDEFMSYYNVQMSGRYNMIMEASMVMAETGLSKEKYFEIINNYSKYRKEFIG